MRGLHTMWIGSAGKRCSVVGGVPLFQSFTLCVKSGHRATGFEEPRDGGHKNERDHKCPNQPAAILARITLTAAYKRNAPHTRNAKTKTTPYSVNGIQVIWWRYCRPTLEYTTVTPVA